MSEHIHRFLAFSIFCFLIIGSTGCANQGSPRDATIDTAANPSKVDVFFATNRAQEVESANYFGPERGNMSYGISQVGIPPGHLMGRQESPSLLKFEWSPDERKHIKVRDVLRLTQDEFFRQLANTVAKSPDGKLMVYLHGYNLGFLEACRDAAQFASDLKFSGPVVLFSWPSQDSLTEYTVDETNAEWAQADFVQLLTELLDSITAKNIYVVGHSMGNRIIGRGMISLESDRLPEDLFVFREIIMIAPDIDADVFRSDIAPRLTKTGIHTTVYASSNDQALRASKVFHGYARAGEAGEDLLILDGIETVDATDVSTSYLGHSDFLEDRRIMEDIFSLLQTGLRAEQRFGLEGVDNPAGRRYWTFRK